MQKQPLQLDPCVPPLVLKQGTQCGPLRSPQTCPFPATLTPHLDVGHLGTGHEKGEPWGNVGGLGQQVGVLGAFVLGLDGLRSRNGGQWPQIPGPFSWLLVQHARNRVNVQWCNRSHAHPSQSL